MTKLNDFRNVRFIDLTHPLNEDVPSWSGSCGFQHAMRDDYDPEAPFQFRTYNLTLQEGIGTHMDAPAHCIPGGKRIHELNINDLIAPCVVIDISERAHEKYSLSVEDINNFESQFGQIQPGTFVLIWTGWARFWENPEKYRNDYVFPSVSKEAAELFVRRQIVGLGIDTLSPDRPEDGFHVHKILLSAGKYIVENVANGSSLPPKGVYTFALPIKIQDGSEAPIRLIGMVKND